MSDWMSDSDDRVVWRDWHDKRVKAEFELGHVKGYAAGLAHAVKRLREMAREVSGAGPGWLYEAADTLEREGKGT